MVPNADVGSRRGPGSAIVLAVLVSVGIAAGLAGPHRAKAQERCETVSGAELDALRNSLEKKASLRDSLRRILVEAGAYDSAGALLVWTDEEEMKMRMALVNLDPPAKADYRIRGLLAGYFSDAPARARNVAVDFDAPDVAIHGDAARVCGCGVPTDVGDRHVGEYMKQAIRRHPDFGTYHFEKKGRVSVFVDWQGKVLHAVLDDSTGDGWLDKVIPPIAREMEFEPASVDGTPRGGWLSRQLRFRNVAR